METSTGVLNDLRELQRICSRAEVKLCVDAVSALGMIPVDLREIWFASGVSGKGLRGFPGLALVFYNHPVSPGGHVPRYLDLSLYARADSVPFTHSSNLLRALRAALQDAGWDERFRAIAEDSAWLREHLRTCGFQIVSAGADAAPGIITLALPAELSSTRVGLELEREGYALAAHSAYLRERNWLQITLMSLPSRAQLEGAVEALRRVCAPSDTHNLL